MSSARRPEPQDAGDSFARHSAKVSRQALVFLAGTAFSVVLGYLFKIWLGRVIGAEGLGLYALGLRVVELAALVANFGLSVALARHVALYMGTGEGGRVRSLLLSALGISTLAALLLAGLVLLARHVLAREIFASPALATYLPLFALLIPITTIHTLLGQYLRGHQEVSRRTVINHFFRLPLGIALTVVLFTTGLGLTAYILGELLSQLAAVILLAYFGARLTPPAGGAGAAPGLDSRVRAYAGSMLGLETLRFLAARGDVVVLGILLDAAQVGIYSMAVATAAIVPTLLRALNSIFGPIASMLHAREERDVLARLFHTTTKWCFAFTVPLALCLMLFAREMMGLFGNEFRAGAAALTLLVLGQLIHVGTGPVGNLLIMSGHERAELLATGWTATVGLALDFLLIPRWGIEGAALAMVAALATTNGLRVAMTRRFLDLWPYRSRALWLLLPLAAGALAALTVRLSPSLWPWQSPIAALVLALIVSYLVFMATARFALDEDDRQLLASATQKGRAMLSARGR